MLFTEKMQECGNAFISHLAMELTLQAENDIVQSTIKKYRDLNKTRQESDSYARNIRNQTKEINQTQTSTQQAEIKPTHKENTGSVFVDPNNK